MTRILVFTAAALSTLTESSLSTATGPQQGHVLVYDSGRQAVVLAPGERRETWALAGHMWSLLSREGPAARLKSAMAYDGLRGAIVLFGGQSPAGNTLGDTWEWDGLRWKEIVVSPGPGPRAGHAMCFHSRLQRIVLYGGRGKGVMEKEMWTWDGAEWKPLPTPRKGPDTNSYNSMAYDSIRDRLVHHRLGETWEWDGKEWTLLATTGPRRVLHALAFDGARGYVLLFGGTERGEPLGDTWAWDGEEWKRLADSGPPARQTPAMAYDAAQERTVLFGGTGLFETPFLHFRRLDDVWTWDGASWSQVATSASTQTAAALAPRGGQTTASGPQRLDTITALGAPLDATFKHEKLRVYVVKILAGRGRKSMLWGVAPFNGLPPKTKDEAKEEGYEADGMVKFIFGETKSGRMLSSTEDWPTHLLE